jgi:hypothetical protein
MQIRVICAPPDCRDIHSDERAESGDLECFPVQRLARIVT